MGVKEQYRDYIMTGFVKRVEPVVVDHGEGATLWDEDGVEYIDSFAGISVTNAGHGNRQIIEAAKAQADKLVHACTYAYHVAPAAELAQRLAEVTPGDLQKSFFCNSGAEANEGAMRLAKRYTGTMEFVALESSFHGRTYATLCDHRQLGPQEGRQPLHAGRRLRAHALLLPLPARPRGPRELRPGLRRARQGDHPPAPLRLAGCAFIAEPVMGEGGIIVPPDDYFKAVKKILDDEGMLFIADEVQSGYSRTGKLFAIEHYGVEAGHHDHGQGHRRRLAAGRLHRPG